MDLHLEDWEVNMILTLLEAQPYKEVVVTIRKILEQMV